MQTQPHERATPTGGTVGGADETLGRAQLSCLFYHHEGPYVKLIGQSAQLAAHHREQAAWCRERAARWLEFAHLSPWHARQYFMHVDAAAWHEKLAERHARICAALEGAGS